MSFEEFRKKNEARKKEIAEYVSGIENKDFSLISSNCNGAVIIHDLGLEFRSPFVNLWMKPADFIRFCSDIPYYSKCHLIPTKEKGINCPVGKIKGMKIYFEHYKNWWEAKKKWKQRINRINFDNIYIMMTERDGCTYEDLLAFDKLPFGKKVVFTHIEYPEIKSAYYIHGFEDKKECGILTDFIDEKSNKKYIDEFDFVRWFNEK